MSNLSLNRFDKYVEKVEVEREYERNNAKFKKKSNEYKCSFCEEQSPQKTSMLSHVGKEHADKVEPLDTNPLPKEEVNEQVPEAKEIPKETLEFKPIVGVKPQETNTGASHAQENMATKNSPGWFDSVLDLLEGDED